MARILLIDDEELVRETIKLQLEIDGHEVTVAANGREGLKLFESAAFDLVITDILMPEVEGIETLRKLQQMSPSIRIVAMTGGPKMPLGINAVVEPDYLKMAKALGASRTIHKPFTGEQLRLLVRDCLRDGGSGSGFDSSRVG